jgi:hypothetical protein
VVVVLSSVILYLVSSQSRLTHHQVSRIQAYYASLAGINYARERLRINTWTTASCPPPDGCTLSDSNFPNSIQNRQVTIVIRTPGSAGCVNPPGNSACISATAIYTYTPTP